MPPPDHALARRLVLDELFDLTFYQELLKSSRGELRSVLEQLVPVETRHLAFWKEFFGVQEAALDLSRRLKLRVLVWICRLFGPLAVQLALEAIEVYGIRKYLSVWRSYRGEPLAQAVAGVLRDEFEHEDAIVSGSSPRTLRPDDVRSIFLGLNDGLVEILGAVSGFFAAFSRPEMVLMAGSTVAVAGAISMAAGAFAASSSESELLRLERERAAFLKARRGAEPPEPAHPFRSAALMGSSYFLGALVPLLPVLLGARTLGASLAAAGSVLLLVTYALAFLSGMEPLRRLATNLALMSFAVAFTYAIGLFARRAWGIAV